LAAARSATRPRTWRWAKEGHRSTSARTGAETGAGRGSARAAQQLTGATSSPRALRREPVKGLAVTDASTGSECYPETGHRSWRGFPSEHRLEGRRGGWPRSVAGEGGSSGGTPAEPRLSGYADWFRAAENRMAGLAGRRRPHGWPCGPPKTAWLALRAAEGRMTGPAGRPSRHGGPNWPPGAA
jgi:hypothetical protein